MIGYHYTSWENWQQIKIRGLIPYEINHPDIAKLTSEKIYGVFSWRDNHKGLDHLNNILFQMASKGSTRIVKLTYNYRKEDVFHHDGMRVLISHDSYMFCSVGGVDKDVQYHDSKKAFIVTKKIHPKWIKLIGDYNLLKLTI